MLGKRMKHTKSCTIRCIVREKLAATTQNADHSCRCTVDTGEGSTDIPSRGFLLQNTLSYSKVTVAYWSRSHFDDMPRTKRFTKRTGSDAKNRSELCFTSSQGSRSLLGQVLPDNQQQPTSYLPDGDFWNCIYSSPRSCDLPLSINRELPRQSHQNVTTTIIKNASTLQQSSPPDTPCPFVTVSLPHATSLQV
ncbi:hypothetical protein TNCV_3625441 [Trichonephila clavipes]|nr:hypothetical protein TNCV_3625441 [Trichonephila clavipes]